MILFLGEVSLNGELPATSKPKNPKINQAWKTISTGNSSIQVCDFSPSKNRTVENEFYANSLSGNPVIRKADTAIPEQIRYIANGILAGDIQVLDEANGVFCGFCIDKTKETIHIYTDYLGFRHIYFCITDDRLVFSNTYWLLRQALDDKLTHNLDAVVEQGVLGFPLDNRTIVKEINLLPAGQVMSVYKNGEISTHQYFDLCDVLPAAITEFEALENLNSIWKTAVADRLSGTNSAFAFLSGGMDSRLLVNTLQELGVAVTTANYAPPETRDRIFGDMSAKAIGVRHFQHPCGGVFIDEIIKETINAWQEDNSYESSFFSSAPLVWSGDGGSVGLGHVYLADHLDELARAERYNECAEAICAHNKWQVSQRLFRDSAIGQKFIDRIANLLARCGKKNPERAPYFFLMLNDQRRHLDRHFERFHEREFDYILPFFDKRLIQFLAAMPSGWMNYHRLYDKLFHKIGGRLTSTPWQTYPGHQPCPLPMPSGLRYQWDSDFHNKDEERKKTINDALFCIKNIRNTSLTNNEINKNYMAICLLTTFLGLTNHSFIRNYIEPTVRHPQKKANQ